MKRDAMPELTLVEEDHRDTLFLQYTMRDTEKSLDDHTSPGSQRDLSVLTNQQSGIYEFFDPNIDSNSDILEEDSPYPEVRSAVANFDDPTMPASTFRSWVLGIFWAILLSGMNQFFYFRYPSIVIGALVAQLLVFPAGRAWAQIVPSVRISGISLNPGHFTIKEHVLVTIMASVGAQSAYATDVIAAQRVYYHQVYSFSYQWMIVMSTQLIGFSIGGIARRFLVSPPSMIWPSTLVSCALFNTLHSQTYTGIGRHEGMSRERYFAYALVAAIVWYFVPGYLFQALSMFSWVCWLAPENIIVNQLFGYRSGLGFSILTLDWSVIAYTGSPLATPWWAQANVMIGFFIFFWFITPVLYYRNVWYSQYLPMSSLYPFDNEGLQYTVSRILNNDTSINKEAYKNYSPLFLSATFVMSYGLSFLAIASTVTHAIIHFWNPIKVQFRRSLREQADIHAQLMSRYPQVPEWYYACIFVVTFTFACVCIQVWPTGLPVWALVLALVIAAIYIIPIGMIQAITNRQIGLNVITELIIGFLLPGRPISMMLFKTFGYVTMAQAIQFTTDFKLGHYMKIPPRPMFWCQIVATIVAGSTQLGVQTWMFKNIPDICDHIQKDHFICAGTQVFGTASIVWGVIGPKLQFAQGQVYYALTFLFLIGAACPVILWLITRKYPNTILNYVNFPLIFAGVGLIPPATSVNFVPWAIIGFIFQYIIRRKCFSYWAKFNYVLSAALDAGTAIGVILVYFCLQYPLEGKLFPSIQLWWGNTVFLHTADWRSTPLKTVPPGKKFGPETW